MLRPTLAAIDLQTHLNSLVGQKCWSVIAGAGTGSTLHVFFGAQILRARPIRNRWLTEAERTHEGEFSLFVECAWRLERGNTMVCGSTDDERNDGPMVQGLAQLVGRTIEGVTLNTPVPDLTVGFDDSLRLVVFCDQTNVEAGYDNYSVRARDTIIIVGSRGVLQLEQRKVN